MHEPPTKVISEQDDHIRHHYGKSQVFGQRPRCPAVYVLETLLAFRYFNSQHLYSKVQFLRKCAESPNSWFVFYDLLWFPIWLVVRLVAWLLAWFRTGPVDGQAAGLLHVAQNVDDSIDHLAATVLVVVTISTITHIDNLTKAMGEKFTKKLWKTTRN